MRIVGIQPLKIWCRRPGSNRHGPFGPWDFKSQASAYSATPACMTVIDERLIAKSIRGCWRDGDLNGEKRTMRHSQLSIRRDLVYVRGMVTTNVSSLACRGRL